MNEVYRAALTYARKGMPVFPCSRRDKRPQTPNGFRNATTDEARIAAWFDVPEPPMIGIPTGAASNTWILDIDRKHGIDGQDALDVLTAEHGALPDTPISMTPSGGYHHLFRCAGQVRTRAGLRPGIDVRGDGGYFVAPPSVCDGDGGKNVAGHYAWEASSPGHIAEAPPWLAELVAPPAPRQPRPVQAPSERDRRQALEALEAITYNGEGRDRWLEIGMGYKAAGGDYETFEAWSARQPGYDGEKIGSEWESWDADGGITAGTLYHYAREAGWRSGPKVVFGAAQGPEADEAPDLELEMAVSRKGDVIGAKPTLANVVTVLERHPRWVGRLVYNELAGMPEILTDRGPEELADNHVHELRVWLDTGIAWQAKPARAVVFDACETVCRRAAYHPVRDYLNSLLWDGSHRAAEWLTDYCGTPRDEYTMAVAVKMLVGAVARVFDPGCKLDTMPVLVGPQGARKSTLISVLSRGWHVDTPFVIGQKDAYQTLQGAWCYEFAELAAMHGRDVERLKAFFSSAHDTYRPAYGRLVQRHARQCWFVATTNDDEFLHDATGSRRFWPVSVADCDVEALKENVDQLWAEAVALYRAGEPWHLEGEAVTLAETAADAHYTEDPWEALIEEYVAGKDRVSRNELFEMLKIEPDRRNRADGMRLTRVMVGRLKWHKRTIRTGDVTARGFVRRDKKPVVTLVSRHM